VIIIDYNGNEYIEVDERKNLNDVTIPSVIISNMDGNDLKSAGLCTTVSVGSNTDGTAAKTVEVDAGYTCPATVNRDNWLGTDSHPNIFSVTQTGNSISVLRTDASEPWGMNLQFHCCAGGETALTASLHCNLDTPLDYLIGGSGTTHEISISDVTDDAGNSCYGMPHTQQALASVLFCCEECNPRLTNSHLTTLAKRSVEDGGAFWRDPSGERLDCVEVDAGFGAASENVIQIPQGYTCPTTVDRTNWLGIETYNTEFDIEQIIAFDGTSTITISVGRGNWDVDLRFHCCIAAHCDDRNAVYKTDGNHPFLSQHLFA
jgi:hypothetical protein